MGAQKTYPNNLMSQKSMSLLLCLKYISMHLKHFSSGQNILNLPLYILKTTVVQPSETQNYDQYVLANLLFLLNFSLLLSSINYDHKHLQLPM